MTHFSVLVIGNNPEEQLAPHHEFECTGINDQYVVDVDVTDDYRERYETGFLTRYQDAAGILYDPEDDRFFRDPTPDEAQDIGLLGLTGVSHGLDWSRRDWGDGRGDRAKIHYVPEGFAEVERPCRDLMTFTRYCTEKEEIAAVPAGTDPDRSGAHKFWYCLLDAEGGVVKVVHRTNPHKKWDWYRLGGRWAGFFLKKPGWRDFEIWPEPLVAPAPNGGRADAALVRDIDFDGMRVGAETHAARKFDAVRAVIEPHLPMRTWGEILEQYSPGQGTAQLPGGIQAAWEVYQAQPAIRALRDADLVSWREKAESYLVNRDEFIRRAGMRSIMTCAVIKEGRWYQREMRTWTAEADAKEDQAWADVFYGLLADLPNDTLLSVYDCHM